MLLYSLLPKASHRDRLVTSPTSPLSMKYIPYNFEENFVDGMTPQQKLAVHEFFEFWSFVNDMCIATYANAQSTVYFFSWARLTIVEY